MERLQQVLAQPDTVLFVGSGISRWSGLPSWPGFIEELAGFVETSGANADLVRAEAQRGDLLQAASYGFDKLTKPQIGEFIREACRYGIAKPHLVHRKLVSLGPRCFITTNYDNLIEEGLRIWQPHGFFRLVTNRQLTETAEIVHARAVDFVFKPHGDAADSDSIILTREQYRQLLPDGERHAALDAVKTLLLSRPVVYIGFGLRDPDFLYVRDLLSNTYKGGTRDHYAIIADIVETEVDYWRRNYGIHLVGYQTTECADGSRDHSALLKVLDDLLVLAPPSVASASTLPIGAPCPPDAVLALARHAGRLTRAAQQRDPEFPIRVHLEESRRHRRYYSRPDEFDHCRVDRFLDEGPPRALLIGLPGSGKSYSLQRAAARLAERLHESCLSETFDEKSVVVPVIADLKLYGGDLYDLVNRTLPSGLALDDLSQRMKVKIFLDSFNEMPREVWESGSYEADFTRFIERNSNASFVIASRTDDGLTKIGFPSYHLDQIDAEFVRVELERSGITIRGRFQSEVRWLLQQPFYFHFVISGAVSLPDEAHPRDFYKTFFSAVTNSFNERFGGQFNLEHALSLSAYEAIDRGEEAQPLSNFLEILNTRLQAANLQQVKAIDVTNWLVSKSVLIPYRGGRIAFFHQSATEYLAACELAHRYQENRRMLKEKLRFTRWDQALFLTLSILPPRDGAVFLKTVIESDFDLALRATKYLEIGRDDVIAKLLSQIPARIKGLDTYETAIEWAVQSGLPISEVHEPQLRAVIKCGNVLGGAAASRLTELKGASVKDELLESLLHARNDFNYCRRVGEALAPFATADDVEKIVKMADSLEGKTPLKHPANDEDDDERILGFICGVASFLVGLELSVIRRGLLPDRPEPISKLRAAILCEILQEKHSTEALDLAAELLMRGVDQAATTVYFISHFSDPEDCLSWSTWSGKHVDHLVSKLDDQESSDWQLCALQCLCDARPDLGKLVEARALKASGIMKAALLYCAHSADTGPLYQALAELQSMDIEGLRKQPLRLLGEMELDWKGHDELFVDLVQLRDTQVALALFGSSTFARTVKGVEKIEVRWWLEWLNYETGTESGFWLCHQVAHLLVNAESAGSRQAFVAEFNKPDSPYRRLLAFYILPYFPDITTDSFSEDAISFLIADLKRNRIPRRFEGHLLGRTATEQFVTDRLLPLLSNAKPRLSENLRKVLRQAGSRHGRRYDLG